MTSNAGLWAFLLGDKVRFVSLKPPRVVVTGRTSYMMSAFGEHLIEEEVEDAVTGAARGIASNVTDFSLGAIYSTRAGELGDHLFIVEFDTAVDEPALAAFARHIDQRLSALNDDFRGHRADGFALAAPRVQVVPPGFFVNWMKSRGKLGGQHKVPRMLNDPSKFAELRRFADDYTA